MANKVKGKAVSSVTVEFEINPFDGTATIYHPEGHVENIPKGAFEARYKVLSEPKREE